jgi:hypothetical protein
MRNKKMEVALKAMLLVESKYEFNRESLKMDPRINISWGDWMVEEDDRQKNYYLNLSNSEWEELVKKHLRNFKGDIRSAVAWVQRVQQARITRASARAEERPYEKPSDLDITFRLWKDMIEEPWKYDDWEEWLDMDRQLRNSKKRWRVAAFWQNKQDEADRQILEEMATRIQAAWRGHQLRDTHPQLNCPICLAHVPCRFMCSECALEDHCCHWCDVPLQDGQEAFCDGDCYRKFMNESWRD